MLKELLEHSFYVTYPAKSHVTVALEENVYDGDFSLVDPKACRDCRHQCSDVETERAQLRVDARTEVHVISIDEVMGNIEEQVGDSCDYMLDDNKKVAFVEMTCSTSDYVIGKRQKARRQLYNTLCLLYTNPDVRAHLEREKERFVIFSWRETFPKGDGGLDLAESAMMGMTSLVDDVYSPENVSKFDFGFLMREIRFPARLKW